MRDDEKMLNWGGGLFALAFALMTLLQVCFRAQERQLARVTSERIRVQQDYAEENARFSALTRPEVLRGVVAEMYPKFEPIGFKKNITAGEIDLSISK